MGGYRPLVAGAREEGQNGERQIQDRVKRTIPVIGSARLSFASAAPARDRTIGDTTKKLALPISMRGRVTPHDSLPIEICLLA